MNPTNTKKSAIKVLIAEDHPVVAKTIEVAVCRIGHKCIAIAQDGHEAIENALALRPDIILMGISICQ